MLNSFTALFKRREWVTILIKSFMMFPYKGI